MSTSENIEWTPNLLAVSNSAEGDDLSSKTAKSAETPIVAKDTASDGRVVVDDGSSVSKPAAVYPKRAAEISLAQYPSAMMAQMSHLQMQVNALQTSLAGYAAASKAQSQPAVTTSLSDSELRRQMTAQTESFKKLEGLLVSIAMNGRSQLAILDLFKTSTWGR